MWAPMSVTRSACAPDQRPVASCRDLDVDLRREVAVVVHVLFARQRQLDRPPRLEGQGHADRHRGVHLDAGAEAPADGHLDNADLAERDAENLAEDDAHVVDRLGRRPDGDAAVASGRQTTDLVSICA